MRRNAHRKPSGRLSAALLALIVTAVGLTTLHATSGTASASTAAAPGRIAFGGTQHRSIGVVEPTTPTSTVPFFPGGPQHYDDEVSARGDAVVWTSLRDSAFPQIHLKRGDGPPVRITKDLTGVQHPVLSPDGSRIAFAATTGRADSGHDIWVLNADGTGAQRLTEGQDDNIWPTWSPTGDSIAYSSDRNKPTQGWEIYSVPASGGAVRQITSENFTSLNNAVLGATEPDYDPVAGHARLLFTSTTPAPAGSSANQVSRHLMVLNLGAGGALDFFPDTPAEETHTGSWSPDGTRAAYLTAMRPSGRENTIDCLYTAEPYGKSAGRQQMLAEDRQIGRPTWYTPAHGTSELLVPRDSAGTATTMDLTDVRPDGSDPRDLLLPLRDLTFDRGVGDAGQRYSPDGRRIAVTRTEPYGDTRISRIWIADADGSNAAPMLDDATQRGETDDFPAWSPDGRRIALTRSGIVGRPATWISVLDVTTGHELYSVSAPPGQSDSRPEFSPDGQSLVFTRRDTPGDVYNTHIWSALASDGSGQTDLSAVAPGPRSRFGTMNDDDAVYSPDGRTLAFLTSGGLSRMDADGRHFRRLADPQNVCGPAGCSNLAWSPDGARLLVNGRPQEGLVAVAVVDPISGAGSWISSTGGAPGQQAMPTWQRTADLTTAVATPPRAIVAGAATSLVLTVTDLGPVDDPAVQVALTVPSGLRTTGLTPSRGTCRLATLTCDLGTVATDQMVQVRVDLVGSTTGVHDVTWTTTGGVLDPDPADNHADAPVYVGGLPPSPAVSIAAAPSPAYVGGPVTLTYTVTNHGGRPATGLRLLPALPATAPASQWPAGCDPAGGCPIADLAPDASAVVRLAVTPTSEGSLDLAATVTSTDPEAVMGANRAQLTLPVRRPGIVATPPVGSPGFVTLVRGHDFPPGVPVTLHWNRGITAAATPAVPAPDGSFTAQLLILPGDEIGSRTVTATGAGYAPATAAFLVVAEPWGPPLYFGGRQ